jgi:hypothetical protein
MPLPKIVQNIRVSVYGTKSDLSHHQYLKKRNETREETIKERGKKRKRGDKEEGWKQDKERERE